MTKLILNLLQILNVFNRFIKRNDYVLTRFLDRQFTHTNIIQSAPLSGEKGFGWFMHYAIGIVIALIMLWIFQIGLIPLNPYLYALIFGIITVAFPFFIMQPAFGFGIAANKTPAPKIARFRSLLAHLYFGIGLDLAWYIIL